MEELFKIALSEGASEEEKRMQKLERERIKTVVKRVEVSMVMGLGLVGGVAGFVLACVVGKAMKIRH